MGNITEYNPSQLATIKRTVAADTNDVEFDLFMEAAKAYGLDPFRRQISAIVFNKTKPDKRKMQIIVGRDGLRSVAHSCGDYRPASGPAQFVCDENAKNSTNPIGVISCGVTVYKQDQSGAWHPVYGEAYWDEFAPVTDEWAFCEQSRKRKPTGKKTVDGQWAKMPRLMIQKCAEAQALRAGWPDRMGGLYAEEEMDVAKMRDITPSEALAEDEKQRREDRLGGPSILMSMKGDGTMDRIPVGSCADTCLSYIQNNSPEDVRDWSIRNIEPFRDFWAHNANDALEVKRAIEEKLPAAGAN